MSKGMSDELFWDLVDLYETKSISKDEAIEEICKYTNSYDVAVADFSLLKKDNITNEEKLKIKEKLDAKNNRRSRKLA